ncbi:TetR family transcriptional regulator [Mycobacteroides abscessus subsp. massiliense]|nr:TetR family transcriptional regulator [Mycobacteroides abscessus subsp. abscessus]SIL36685.1 TetR family transcriptional regulator [Mycobacteroides abscessus subsp. abscessus]SLH72045.1 TetR family transcriptional regulator [Mycobacteroides abscessus subsp. massiliense]SLI41141.1 TetR family transcriptional regulator [Mycobacteroides abscessus subsp. massiliense]SLI70322.1 TetR family transcriptional regulator [Mycobacteroides abscessus subsp. abscessus]
MALFDQVIDDLLADEERIRNENTDLATALTKLIEGQVEFVVGNRQLAQVYHNEINNLPDEDRRRLRRKQRLYVEEWVHLVDELRQDLDDTEARVIVHASIGAIQSPLFHNTGLADSRLRSLLTESAQAILNVRS